MERHYRTIFGFWALAFILITAQLRSQTAGGANGMVFRFTKQVWLNPTIILAKQSFEQSTNVKLLILPRVNGNDTTGSSRIEKAFDKLLSFLVFKENVQGSIKFYFNPKNPTKPFTFNTSDELFCKFTPIQKDSVETILNKDIVNNANLNNFTALPFDSIINRASRYCKKILQSKPGLCGENPGNEFTLTKINSTPAKLNFEKGLNPNAAAPNGGVDRKKYPELEQYYNTVLDVADNSNYPLAWKAMAANTSDVIKLKLKKKENYFDISKLVFKNANGTETYNVTYNNIGRDSIIDLSISGKSPGSMTEVVAYYTPTTTPTQTFAIGAFNVQFYEPKTLNVVLVNLGGITLPDANAIKDSLNKIYGQAFVKWNVTTVNYTLPGTINKNIHVESSSLLSNYMPDMQPIVSSFKDNCTAYNGSSDNTFYLLFGATNDGNLLGYMPRARNTGFIFSQNSVTDPSDIIKAMPRTIAHELGHGAFNLKHIFSSDELGEGNHSLTDNIMDYKGGSSPANQSILYKYQWDCIHNPGFVGWFEGDDEEAANMAAENCDPHSVPYTLKQIALICNNSTDTDFENYISTTSGYNDLKKLCVKQRIDLIKCIINGSVVEDEDEVSVTKLLETTPNDHIDAVLTELKKVPSFAEDSEPLWMFIIDEFDETENIQKLNEIYSYFSKNKSPNYLKNQVENKIVLYGHNNEKIESTPDDALKQSRLIAESNGMITIQCIYTHLFPVGVGPNNAASANEFTTLTIDPFDDICVSLIHSVSKQSLIDNGFELVNDKYVSMPACLWHYIGNNETKKFIGNAYLTVFGKVLSGFGFGQYQYFTGFLRYALIAADVISAANLIIDNPATKAAIYRADPSGQFNYYWSKVSLVSSGVYLTAFGKTIVSGLINSYKLKKSSLQNELSNNDFEKIDDAINKIDEASKIGLIDNSIGAVAPYLDELKALGITIRKMTTAEANSLLAVKTGNTIKAEVNVAKAEVTMKNGQTYTSYAASGFPDAKKGNILTSPVGADFAKKGNSVLGQYASRWEGLDRFNDTEVKLLEEFALKFGAQRNVANQIFNSVEGEIKLFTQLCPCGSCMNVIKTFQKMFPKVKMEIVTTPMTKF